jgi:type IV secretory pathway TrbD component
MTESTEHRENRIRLESLIALVFMGLCGFCGFLALIYGFFQKDWFGLIFGTIIAAIAVVGSSLILILAKREPGKEEE